MVKRTNSQRGKLSQRKGKGFAIDIAERLANIFGVRVDLNPHQCKGQHIGRDLLADLPFCFQVSHSDNPNVYKKLEDARWSAREGEVPVAILRKTRKPIIVAMYFEDWAELAVEWREENGK